MELYVIAGGQLDHLHRWQDDLNSQFLPIYDKDGNHKDIDGMKQYRRLLVAPVQLYKIAFNKENLNEVMSMVGSPKETENHVLKYSILKKIKNIVRRVLGLKAVPNPTRFNPFLQPNPYDKAVFVVPIGIKEDIKDKDGEEMI